MSLRGCKDYIECNIKYYKYGNGKGHKGKYSSTPKVIFWSIVEYITNKIKD